MYILHVHYDDSSKNSSEEYTTLSGARCDLAEVLGFDEDEIVGWIIEDENGMVIDYMR